MQDEQEVQEQYVRMTPETLPPKVLGWVHDAYPTLPDDYAVNAIEVFREAGYHADTEGFMDEFLKLVGTNLVALLVGTIDDPNEQIACWNEFSTSVLFLLTSKRVVRVKEQE
jgi:hypothetical protein